MVSKALFVSALLLVTASVVPVVSAQDASPEAGSMEAVIVYNQDGTVLGAISVVEVIDPFELYDPGYPPERSHRQVAVTFDVENTGQRPWSFNPAHLYLVDEQGYSVQGMNARLTEDATIAIMASQDVALGATLTGSVVYQIPNGVAIDRLVYSPASDRLITVARMSSSGPEVGTSIEVVGNDGTAMVVVSVDSYENPFAGYEENSPPERGSNYVLITVSAMNPGPRPMQINPNTFWLVDADGFVFKPVAIRRGEAPPPDLQSISPFTPGESTQGGVGYLVLSGVPIESVMYVPSSGRLIEVAVVESDRSQRS